MSDLLFLSPPSATLPVLERALLRAGSPASPSAARLYGICIGYGIDPAVAWTFFAHESTYGTQGKARLTLNWGNLRKSQGRASKEAEGFAWYRSWEDSLHDWCTLIKNYYIPRGLDTVRKAIPVYAPSSDHNKPDAYIAFVLMQWAKWVNETATLDPWGAWGSAYPLPDEQRGFAIPQAWLRLQGTAGALGKAISREHTWEGGAWRIFDAGCIVWFREDNRCEVYR